jgi:hypothetical protein
MRISSRPRTQQPTPIRDAKPAFAKGIVRTPSKPRGKLGVEKVPEHESSALRDFMRNRGPEDPSRPDSSGILGRLRRGLSGRRPDGGAARDGVADAAGAEAWGQRGALWDRLRDQIENRVRDSIEGGVHAPRPVEPGEIPVIKKIARESDPAIIRTPVSWLTSTKH